MRKVAPLSTGFLITSIVGFLVSALKIYPMDRTWGFTLMLFFLILFIASMISMTYADADALIAIDEH